MSIFESLENSAIGTWVSQSPAGFYILLAIHSTGMAMVVGVMMVISLRLLGFAPKISLEALPKLARFSWVGFWLNFASGVMLFIGEASKMFYNWSFRFKILFVAIGMVLTYILTRTVLKPAAAGNTSVASSQSAKLQAVLNMLIWVAVICAGRWIAYIGQIEVLE